MAGAVADAPENSALKLIDEVLQDLQALKDPSTQLDITRCFDQARSTALRLIQGSKSLQLLYLVTHLSGIHATIRPYNNVTASQEHAQRQIIDVVVENAVLALDDTLTSLMYFSDLSLPDEQFSPGDISTDSSTRSDELFRQRFDDSSPPHPWYGNASPFSDSAPSEARNSASPSPELPSSSTPTMANASSASFKVKPSTPSRRYSLYHLYQRRFQEAPSPPKPTIRSDLSEPEPQNNEVPWPTAHHRLPSSSVIEYIPGSPKPDTQSGAGMEKNKLSPGALLYANAMAAINANNPQGTDRYGSPPNVSHPSTTKLLSSPAGTSDSLNDPTGDNIYLQRLLLAQDTLRKSSAGIGASGITVQPPNMWNTQPHLGSSQHDVFETSPTPEQSSHSVHHASRQSRSAPYIPPFASPPTSIATNVPTRPSYQFSDDVLNRPDTSLSGNLHAGNNLGRASHIPLNSDEFRPYHPPLDPAVIWDDQSKVAEPPGVGRRGSTSSLSRIFDHVKLESTRELKSESSNIGLPATSRGITQFTLEELCDEIRSSPQLAMYPVDDLYRREIPSGVQHEFIIVRSAPRNGRPATWIRIDRAAMGYRDRIRLTSRYDADDTARMGTTENHRLMAGGSRLRAHVVFGTPKGPKFITLADLLSIMHEESQEYKLLSENCYFFTSVIQEILTEIHEGELVSGSLGHKTLGIDVRTKVKHRFVHRDGMDVKKITQNLDGTTGKSRKSGVFTGLMPRTLMSKRPS